RGQHRLTVVHVARQAALAEGLTEVAGVRGEHDLSVIEPQPKGLVPRRVPVCRQTHHRAIAKLVVLAIHQPRFMAEVEIARIEPTPRGGIGVHTSFPLAALHQHRCVRDQRIAANMLEMEMRVDDALDLAGISVDRFEPPTNFSPRLKADPEKTREPRAKSSSG